MESQPGPALIRVLRPELADLIAAGEVVERPASVVKELCENAIDAGATKIEVIINVGGRRLIKVADNGSGMTAEDARLALRRHATSKLTAAEQLWGIATLGFRGEALPSIAAVSRLSLTTKPAAADVGVQLDVVAGQEKGFKEVGVPQGTGVEIRDLFFNTPARLKFLKTDSTETASATETVLRLAIGHPEVHFHLTVDGRQALDLPVHRSRGERVRAALARRGASVVHEVVVGDGPYTFNLFLAQPEESTTSSSATFLFVGRRYVRDRLLLRAVVEGCGATLEKGRYPLAVLFLEVPPDEVDVNAHPQKTEVRFLKADMVAAAVKRIVGTALAKAPWAESAPRSHSSVGALVGEGKVKPTVFGSSPAAALRAQVESEFRPPSAGASNGPASTPTAGAAPSASPAASPRPRPAQREQRALPLEAREESAGPWPSAPQTVQIPTPVQPPPAASQAERRAPTPERAGPVRLLQPLDAYLVCFLEQALYIVDPHAAAEVVTRRALHAELAADGVATVPLLNQAPLRLDPELKIVFQHKRGLLNILGFAFAESPGVVVLTAVPRCLRLVPSGPLVAAVMREVLAVANVSPEQRIDRLVDVMAAQRREHGSEEPARLVSALTAEDLTATCRAGTRVAMKVTPRDVAAALAAPSS
jgi:DNA mismatch repair protein MutL